MFGVDSGEFFIIVLVAVVVIGPKELPRVMRTIGHWVGKARGMANQFRSGVDQMVRESEIADLEKKWREQNNAIMKANPLAPKDSGWGLEGPKDDGAPPVMTALPAPGDGHAAESAPPAASEPVAEAKPAPGAPKPLTPSYPAPRTRAAPKPDADAA